MMDEVNEGCGQLGLEKSCPSLLGWGGGQCRKFKSDPKILRTGRHHRRMSCSPLELGPGGFNLEGLVVGKQGGEDGLFWCAAAAKSLQSCPTLCDPIDGSPPGSPIPGILQARTLEWVAVSFSNACMHAKSLQLCPTLCNPWTASHQAPLSTGFSRQEYRSGLPCPSPFWYKVSGIYDEGREEGWRPSGGPTPRWN